MLAVLKDNMGKLFFTIGKVLVAIFWVLAAWTILRSTGVIWLDQALQIAGALALIIHLIEVRWMMTWAGSMPDKKYHAAMGLLFGMLHLWPLYQKHRKTSAG